MHQALADVRCNNTDITFDSLICVCLLQAVMPRFGDLAALINYLHTLDEDYDGYAPALWASGIRRSEQLANNTVAALMTAGISNELHAGDIKARSGEFAEADVCRSNCRSV